MQLRISRFLTRHPNLLTLWVRKQSHDDQQAEPLLAQINDTIDHFSGAGQGAVPSNQ